MQEINISSRRPIELIDITERVEQIIYDSNIEAGNCNLFVPHATAAIILNENEPGLVSDFEKILKSEYQGIDFEHNRIDNNARSHLLSGFIGSSVNIPFENNKLKLGTWQQIFFVELDGPRSRRKIIVNLIRND